MMRRERGRVIGRRRTEVGPEAEDARPHRKNEDRDRRQVSLQAAGRADATQGAHEEAQVEPADVGCTTVSGYSRAPADAVRRIPPVL